MINIYNFIYNKNDQKLIFISHFVIDGIIFTFLKFYKNKFIHLNLHP